MYIYLDFINYADKNYSKWKSFNWLIEDMENYKIIEDIDFNREYKMKELLFILENLNDKRVSDLYDLISDKFGDNSEELFLVDDIITYNRS